MEGHLPPPSHPRYQSLVIRERLVAGMAAGIVAPQGLLAHGRGEAFDYLLGEQTTDAARRSIDAAAAMLVLARHPVLSVNGNVAALVPKEIVALSRAVPAPLEVNLFYRTEQRVAAIIAHLQAHGAATVLGADPDSRIPGLDHDRGLCTAAGIGSADVVLVPLEDGDRTAALVAAGKRVITIDLNPLSRTAQTAHVTIVDNIVRAVPSLEESVHRLRSDPTSAQAIVARYDNAAMAREQLRRIRSGH